MNILKGKNMDNEETKTITNEEVIAIADAIMNEFDEAFKELAK